MVSGGGADGGDRRSFAGGWRLALVAWALWAPAGAFAQGLPVGAGALTRGLPVGVDSAQGLPVTDVAVGPESWSVSTSPFSVPPAGWQPAHPPQLEPVATRTRANRGLGWGAAVGGALGGLGVGVLASGLCDAADCDGSFVEGFFVGLTMGAIAGAVTGMVVGSAFPVDGRSLGGWSWSLTGGARRAAGADDIDGSGPALGLRALHATTERTRVGFAVEYLGTAEHRDDFQIMTRDGTLEDVSHLREWNLSSVRMVAARFLGSRPGAGGYLVGGAGVYPTWERRTSARELGTGEVRRSTGRSFVVAPGVGVGAGYALDVGGGWAVDLATRADVVAGVSGDGLAAIFQLTLGILRR